MIQIFVPSGPDLTSDQWQSLTQASNQEVDYLLCLEDKVGALFEKLEPVAEEPVGLLDRLRGLTREDGPLQVVVSQGSLALNRLEECLQSLKGHANPKGQTLHPEGWALLSKISGNTLDKRVSKWEKQVAELKELIQPIAFEPTPGADPFERLCEFLKPFESLSQRFYDLETNTHNLSQAALDQLKGDLLREVAPIGDLLAKHLEMAGDDKPLMEQLMLERRRRLHESVVL